MLLFAITFFIIDCKPLNTTENEETLKQCTLRFVEMFEEKQEEIREKEIQILDLSKEVMKLNQDLEKAKLDQQQEMKAENGSQNEESKSEKIENLWKSFAENRRRLRYEDTIRKMEQEFQRLKTNLQQAQQQFDSNQKEGINIDFPDLESFERDLEHEVIWKSPNKYLGQNITNMLNGLMQFKFNLQKLKIQLQEEEEEEGKRVPNGNSNETIPESITESIDHGSRFFEFLRGINNSKV